MRKEKRLVEDFTFVNYSAGQYYYLICPFCGREMQVCCSAWEKGKVACPCGAEILQGVAFKSAGHKKVEKFCKKRPRREE